SVSRDWSSDVCSSDLGVGVVLYTRENTDGGYIALIDLTAGTGKTLNTDNQSDVGFSGNDDIDGTFAQFQNIGVAGDYVYVPMTETGRASSREGAEIRV